MNHYINLLEPAEIHYLSGENRSSLYKIGGVALALLALAFFGMKYNALRKTIEEGEHIRSTWTKIETDVEAAKARVAQNQRVGDARDTLEGWSASNFSWPEIMDFVVSQAPVPLEQLQFTNLYFDEEMVGLKNQRQGMGKVYPLKRKVNVIFRGIIQSERSERMLIQYQRNISSSEEAPVEISSVKIDGYRLLDDENGEHKNQASFVFTIELKEREVLP